MPIIVRAVLLLLACWPLSATAWTQPILDHCPTWRGFEDDPVYKHWEYVYGAARKYNVGHDTCPNGQMFNHAGAECAKRGIAVESPDKDRVTQCIEFGVVDFDCRQTRNPNPNDTPEACVQRRLAGGPKWLVPGVEAWAEDLAAAKVEDERRRAQEEANEQGRPGPRHPNDRGPEWSPYFPAIGTLDGKVLVEQIEFHHARIGVECKQLTEAERQACAVRIRTENDLAGPCRNEALTSDTKWKSVADAEAGLAICNQALSALRAARARWEQEQAGKPPAGEAASMDPPPPPPPPPPAPGEEAADAAAADTEAVEEEEETESEADADSDSAGTGDSAGDDTEGSTGPDDSDDDQTDDSTLEGDVSDGSFDDDSTAQDDSEDSRGSESEDEYEATDETTEDDSNLQGDDESGQPEDAAVEDDSTESADEVGESSADDGSDAQDETEDESRDGGGEDSDADAEAEDEFE